MLKCSALTKKGTACKNKAKYESEGKTYCGTHYVPSTTAATPTSIMSAFDRKIMQLFGTDVHCQSTVTIKNYGTITKTSSRSVLVDGDTVSITVDDSEPITVSGSYILRFTKDILLNSSMEIEGEPNSTSIKYRGIITIIRSDGKYISFADWSSTDKLETDTLTVDNDQSKYILDEPKDGPIADILSIVRSGKSVFITGEAGTGKSYNIGLLTRILDKYEKTSSTGTSAHHIGGRTIHSFSGLGVTTVREFLDTIEENAAANYRSYEKYLKYKELYKLMGIIHSMRSIQILNKREDVLMYIVVLYRYIEFMYPSSKYSERLKAVYDICEKTNTIRGTVSTDTIKTTVGITSNMADSISMKYLNMETAALLKISADHYDVLTRILNKMSEYRQYDPAYRINEVQYLIVDEVSMLSSYDMEMLDWQMRTMRNTLSKFMGGIVMIFVGDLLQLAPVCNKRTTPDVLIDKEKNIRIDGTKVNDIGEWTFGDILQKKLSRYRCSYVTQYSEWMRNVTVYTLTKNYRQSTDTQFRDLLNSIRIGTVTDDCKRLLQERVVTEVDNSAVVLYGKNVDCDARNKYCLDTLDEDLYRYDAEYAVQYTRNTLLGSTESLCTEYNPGILDKVTRTVTSRYKRILELKIGCKVMLLTNLSVQYGLVNGALGTVTALSNSSITVQFETIEVKIPRRVERIHDTIERDTDSDRYIKTEIYMKQYPLTLAYGITIHKSQGNTYDNMVISMSTDDIWNNDYGKAYVALSRCRTLDGLKILSKCIPFNRFVADQKIVSLYRYWTDKA